MECKIFLGDLHESIRRGFVMLVRSYFNHTNRSIWRTMITCYRWARVVYILCLFRSVKKRSFLYFIKVTSSSIPEIQKLTRIDQLLIGIKLCLGLAYVLSRKTHFQHPPSHIRKVGSLNYAVPWFSFEHSVLLTFFLVFCVLSSLCLWIVNS